MTKRTQAEKRAYRQATVGYLRGELDRLRAENSALASWQCVYMDGSGLTGDDHGHQVCMKQCEIERLRDKNRDLNRRCQTYEKAIAEKVKANPGPSLGKYLAIGHAMQVESERDTAIAAKERAEELLRRAVPFVAWHGEGDGLTEEILEALRDDD